MPRFARIFFISLLSAAGSCSGEQLAQKQVERKDIRQQLATAYESCVRTSFASQLPTMVDRNMAIDQAFTVCQTEEMKLQDVSDGAISAYRNTLKEELLRGAESPEPHASRLIAVPEPLCAAPPHLHRRQ